MVKLVEVLGLKINDILLESFLYDKTLSNVIRDYSYRIYNGKDGFKVPSNTRWGTVQSVYPQYSDVCQTKEGIIGPPSYAHPGEEKYNWSIINRFDTNGLVHKKIKEIYEQSGSDDNIYAWFADNAIDFLTPGGKYTNELVSLNKTTYERGEIRERKAIEILNSRFGDLEIKKFCSGSKADFSQGQDLIVTLSDGSNFSIQVKPFDSKHTYKYIDTEGSIYYKLKTQYYNPKQYKPKFVKGLMFIDNDQYIIFANEPNKIFSDKTFSRFYEEPLQTNITFTTRKETSSKMVKDIKTKFSYGSNIDSEIERLEKKMGDIKNLISKLEKKRNS
jgi:hypothetical protein